MQSPLPDRYVEPWAEIVDQARRRRVAVEIRTLGEDQPVDDGVVMRGAFLVVATSRSRGREHVGAGFETFDAALEATRAYLLAQPVPGPTALRDELAEFGKRLALAGPRDFAGRKPTRLYVEYRDRILPLAWDNLVDRTRMEHLEALARQIADLEVAEDLDAALEDAVQAAKGLVP